VAVVVLAVPTPGNAAAIGVRGTDVCVEKCRDRNAYETSRCRFVTIHPVGVIWNTSVSQPMGDEREDPIEACIAKADAALADCIEDCGSAPLVGRDGAMRTPFSARRSR
jgi:hypothetical protein